MTYQRNTDAYTALDVLHWLIDALPTEAWEALPEPLQKRIIQLTGEASCAQ
jgi:hypothetical protein